MSSHHQRLSRTSMRIFMSLNGLILVGLAAWILVPSATAPAPEARLPPEPPAAQTPRPDHPPVPVPVQAEARTAEPQPPTKSEVLNLRGIRFGLSAPDVPWSEARLERLAHAAGAYPTMIQFFVNWNESYPAETVELSYQRGALPVLSWEPWAGLQHGTNQPEYALSKITDGSFDEYIQSFAQAVRDHGWPVVIRLAHEMNGTWYPWSERNSGNQPGEFVEAWRHVHDLFADLDATNVIWLWSPNIIRPVPDVDLEALYPGDPYVDWTGLVGYAVTETTAREVFESSRRAVREFTDRPLVITETGAQPGPHKLAWIEDFFDWLADRPDVIGFIWFEYDIPDGGNADWRFTATAETAEVFQAGLSRVELALPPP